jgi:hypothetical protein
LLVIAHGIVGRADLPIPSELFGAAAAVVLVVSFLALAAGWTRPRLETIRERPLLTIPLAVEVVCGAIGVAVFAIVAYAGLAGTDSQQDNLAPTAVYVGFWVGVPLLSLAIGDWFRMFNPWRAVGRAVGWAANRLAPGEPAEVFPYPERLGHWPAAAGILAFVICELCWGAARDPSPLAVLMLIYAFVQLAGQGVYGVEAWSRRGDAFGVWFGLFATLAPVARRDDGTLVLRPPVVGATRPVPGAGTVALLVIGIGSTGFDGASEGPLFNGVRPDLQDFFASLGASLGFGLELAYVVGLLVAVAMVGALWWLGTLGMPRARADGRDRKGLSRAFAHTLIPIAAAYVVAHYFSLLAYNGQDLWRLASDPLGDGSDLLGGADASIDYSILTATAIWYVQTLALVAGHVAALMLAHDRALVVYGTAKAATRSQIVMLVLMVCFTCLGLWLLSAALSG